MSYTPTWQNPYMPQLPTYQAPQMQQFQQPINGIVKVNGRDSAMQYQLPPNSMSPALFDKSGTCFYIVSTDGTGAKTVETFDFFPHVEQQDATQEATVSRQEYDALVAKVDSIIGVINGIDGSVLQSADATIATDDATAGK